MSSFALGRGHGGCHVFAAMQLYSHHVVLAVLAVLLFLDADIASVSSRRVTGDGTARVVGKTAVLVPSPSPWCGSSDDPGTTKRQSLNGGSDDSSGDLESQWDTNAAACSAGVLGAYKSRVDRDAGFVFGAPGAGASAWGKLERGEDIVVALLGASISSQHGGCTIALPALARAGCGDCCGCGNTKSKAQANVGWARKVCERLPDTLGVGLERVSRGGIHNESIRLPSQQVSEGIQNTSFGIQTRSTVSNVELFNLGAPATEVVDLITDAFDAAMFDFPKRVDVWLLDFAVTMPLDEGGIEKVHTWMRKLLQSSPPGEQPLVLPIEHRMWCGFCEEGVAEGPTTPFQCGSKNGKPFCPNWRTSWRGSGAPVRDDEEVREQRQPREVSMRLLAREFGLPLISVYDHLLGVVADDRVNVSDVSDGMHPSPCGEELTARGISRGMRKMYHKWVCAGRPGFEDAVDTGKTHGGNFRNQNLNRNNSSANENGAPRRVTFTFSKEPESWWPPVRHTNGFTYTAVAEAGHTTVGKPWFVARDAGAFVEIALLRRSSAASAPNENGEEDWRNKTSGDVGVFAKDASDGKTTAQVRLRYLKSYEHMGAIDVSCHGGCTCVPMVVDAHWDEKRSTTGSAEWTVTPAELRGDNSAECLVRLEVRDDPPRPENKSGFKFKLIGMNLSW